MWPSSAPDTKIKEGDQVSRTGTIASVPVGDGVVGRVLSAVGEPLDGEGPVVSTETRNIEIKAPGVTARQPVEPAPDDRPQGHRLDDPHRPRPARADHRRPRHRQDGHRHRRHHQPEGQGRVLLLRRDRPEAVDRGRSVARKLKEHGAMEYTTIIAASASRPRPAAVHRALRRLHHGRALHVAGQGHPRGVRRPFEAGQRLPPDVAAAAPPAGTRGLPRRRVLPA